MSTTVSRRRDNSMDDAPVQLELALAGACEEPAHGWTVVESVEQLAG
jgi:hypothetical protein